MKKVHKCQEELELNSMDWLYVCTDDVNLLADSTNITKNNAKILLQASKKMAWKKNRYN